MNEYAQHKTCVNIIGSVRPRKLNEPPEVYPQMEISPNFYDGEHLIEEEKGPHSSKAKARRRRSEYRKERVIDFSETVKENSITMDGFIKDVSSKKIRKHQENAVEILAFVAPAGAGKTTCMRRCARKIMAENGISSESNYMSSESSQFDMVVYLDMKDLENKEDVHLEDLLFEGRFETKKDQRFAYNWLFENQSRVVIFLDGLDQATFSIAEDDGFRDIPKYGKASTATVFYNVLSRNILSKTPLVISSREFKAAELPKTARPDKIVTLTGLSYPDIKKVFSAFMGDDSDQAWKNLVASSRSLFRLLSIPVFLLFTAIVCYLCTYEGDPLPQTVTELLGLLICQTLCDSENIRDKQHIWTIIPKLKIMAHKGMVDERVMFTKQDLKNLELAIKDVSDLIFTVPSNNFRNPRRAMEGTSRLFFVTRAFRSSCLLA